MNHTAHNARKTFSCHQMRGVSLVESMVVTAVVAIAASAAVPGLGTVKSRQALTSAAAEFETDVQQVRSAVVSGNANLRMSFDARDGASCYIVHSGRAGDCECGRAGEAVCRNGAQARRMVRFPASGAVGLNANVRSMVFDPVRGTTTPAGTVRFTTQGGAAVHQVVNILGRVRSCSPDGAVSGYKAC